MPGSDAALSIVIDSANNVTPKEYSLDAWTYGQQAYMGGCSFTIADFVELEFRDEFGIDPWAPYVNSDLIFDKDGFKLTNSMTDTSLAGTVLQFAIMARTRETRGATFLVTFELDCSKAENVELDE